MTPGADIDARDVQVDPAECGWERGRAATALRLRMGARHGGLLASSHRRSQQRGAAYDCSESKGAIYVTGLVRRPRRSNALPHPSNLASPQGLIVVRPPLRGGYAAAAVAGATGTRVGSYRVPSRSSA